MNEACKAILARDHFDFCGAIMRLYDLDHETRIMFYGLIASITLLAITHMLHLFKGHGCHFVDGACEKQRPDTQQSEEKQ